MEKINKIVTGKEYIDLLTKIDEAEKGRIFCGHDFGHFLDVARIMYLETFIQGLDFSKELVYSVALLHDIGRASEYHTGKDHAKEGAEIAKKMLDDAGFYSDDVVQITFAIANHNAANTSHKLCKLLQLADMKSRNCFLCSVSVQCKWEQGDKNKGVSL